MNLSPVSTQNFLNILPRQRVLDTLYFRWTFYITMDDYITTDVFESFSVRPLFRTYTIRYYTAFNVSFFPILKPHVRST